MKTDNDILEMSATAQAAAIAAGTLTAEALMRATLERIEAVNGALNALVALRPSEELIAEARALDEGEWRGPLHGLPIAIKDLANVKGMVTSMGSPLFKNMVAASDDEMVARMRNAGAILIGKSNTPEFGLGSHTFNPVYGATRNAYDLTRSAGGSSGGAAVALAAGMLSVADGSDMMGSLRNPAAWGNVYGFRPSWGLVPPEPVGEMFLHQLSTSGPMACSPEDIALLLDVQSGADRRVPHGVESPPICHGALEADVKGCRIGWLGDWGGAYTMEAGVIETCEAALTAFEPLGVSVDPVAPPFDAAHLWEAWITLRSWAIAGKLAPVYGDAEQRKFLKPEMIWEIERGMAMSAMDVHRASEVRSDWFRAVDDLFVEYDALLLPSAQVWPFPLEWRAPEVINGAQMDTYHRWMEVVVPVSLIGLPCLNIPAGFGAEGLPMGMQLFGPRGSDLAMLQLGQAWHAATDFTAQRPDIPTAP